MIFKLSAKIFIAFVAMSIISVGLMVLVIRYASHRNFETYLHRKEVAQLEGLAETLADYFQEHQHWQAFEKNPRLLHRMVRSQWLDGGAMPPSQDNLPPPPPDRPKRPPDQNRPPRPDRMPPPSARKPLPIDLRVVLFDDQRKHVAGGRTSRGMDELSLLPITMDGQIKGWLGLEAAPRTAHPLELDFMRQQNRVFSFAGAAILGLSVLLALWLSRHLLAPIRRLTQATHALTQRRFDTRIKVESTDELGQLAHDFNIMAQRLGGYEKRQQQWLSDISHELRTPLAILLGEIEALQDDIRPTDAAALTSLHTEARRLRKIINDLHDLSMAEAGTFSMQLSALDPISLLTCTLARFDTRMDQHELDVDTQLSPAANITMLADADRLEQLFSNILENALQHTNKPGSLKIGHTRVADTLKLRFENSGPAIPSDALPRLFDRLFRVDTSRTRDTGGSGLGLAICKQIVEAHNGKIEAFASPLGGLALEISFPLQP